MSHNLNNAVAVIGIDIGKNSFPRPVRYVHNTARRIGADCLAHRLGSLAFHAQASHPTAVPINALSADGLIFAGLARRTGAQDWRAGLARRAGRAPRDQPSQRNCSIFSGWRDKRHDRFSCCSRTVRIADCS